MRRPSGQKLICVKRRNVEAGFNMPKNGKRSVKKKPRPEFKTRVVRGEFPDRQFDIEFWQEQGAEAIFAAAWEMIRFTGEFKDGRQPAFHRTVTKVKRSQG